MRKINSLLNENHPKKDDPLSVLLTQASSHLILQQLWIAAAPELLSHHSYAGDLTHHQLTVYTHSASVAAKIKLTSASLLTRIENLQNSDPVFKQCKVTGIRVKVQVKSQPSTTVKLPRSITPKAASHLNHLANQLGDSALATQLKQLARKI